MKPLKKLEAKLRDSFREADRLRRPTRDVVVISFPKSGRTWLRFLLNHADVKLKYDHAGAEIKRGHRFDEIADRPRDWAGWRVIFMHRDPRDTVVSGYFQATKRLKDKHGFAGGMSEFLHSPHYGLAKIALYNLRWLGSAWQFRDFTALSYEALHEDGASELARLIDFATGRAPRDGIVDRALAAGSFDNMRRLELALAGRRDNALRLGGGRAGDPEGMKTRKGRVGGWREHFDASDIAYMDDLLAELRYWETIGAADPGSDFDRLDSAA